MKLYLYNTLTRQKEEFVPLVSGKVGMYSCWPTVYRDPSIGNYRATFTADLIRNTLKLLWYQVTAVMNFTDVGHLVSDADDWEDKLEKWSKREWISAWDVAKKYENIFREGMQKLNIDEFDIMPRATEHIQEQIELVKNLEEKWYTYLVEGDGIYMDTSKVEDYGKLMWPNYKKRLEELNAGERIDMWGKKHSTDFALWKFSPIGEKRQMEWESPWWIGFPGWHIECSAMSSKYLGEQFDIHHGWADHITIHHPNEIAQSECAFCKKPWVKYRVHNEFLQVDWGKMGKSLGNAYTLDDIEKKWFSLLDLRYFYFMAQYSNFQNFTWDQLEAAKNARSNLKKKIRSYLSVDNKELNKDILTLSLSQFQNLSNLEFWENYYQEAQDFVQNVIDAICDNLNMPSLFASINKATLSIKKSISFLYYLDQKLLKLWLFEPEGFVEIPAEITDLADQRLQAKQDKNYALADEIRNKISELWWNVKDTKDWYEIVKN